MIRTLLTGAAMIVAFPAVAQTTSAKPEPMPSAATPSKPATPAQPTAPAPASPVPTDPSATGTVSSAAATPATPASPATPSTPATAATPAAQAGTATTATTPANPANAVAAVIDSQFPTYDGDSSGDLSKTEFTQWVTALKNDELKASGKTMTTAELNKWTAGAFATADADKNKIVTKTELTTFLSGGA